MRLQNNAGSNVIAAAPVSKLVYKTDSGLPMDFWRTETQLHWADPRNEQVREDKVTKRSFTPYELSSELFNYPRMAFVSTADPSTDLRAASQNFLSYDSRQNVRTKQALHPEKLLHGDAADMDKKPPVPRHRPQAHRPSAVTRHLSVPDDYRDPSRDGTFTRRHGEKNFSDLFDTELPARSSVKRSKAEDHTTWSWLDSKAPTCSGVAKSTDTFTPRGLREREMSSVIFGEDSLGPRRLVSVPEEEEKKRTMRTMNQEFSCMQANCFDNASEIFRRRSERDFGEDMSARARKQQEFRSAIFEPMDKGAAPQRASRTPRESARNTDSSRSTANVETSRPMTARARLQHITMGKRAEGLY
jgi:hypothetical protein